MLRGKEAAPVRIYIYYIYNALRNRERERKNEKKRNGINQKRQKGNVYRL